MKPVRMFFGTWGVRLRKKWMTNLVGNPLYFDSRESACQWIARRRAKR